MAAKTPCRYREVKAAGRPSDVRGQNSSSFQVGLTLVSTDIRREKERLSVPFETLISNLGGSLGLFLGFSFITVWDWLELVYRYFGAVYLRK